MSRKDIGNEPASSAVPRKPPDEWDKACTTVLRARINLAQISDEELLAKVNALGYDNTSLKNFKQRLARGSFSMGFGMRVLRVLGVENVHIADIPLYKKKSPPRR